MQFSSDNIKEMAGLYILGKIIFQVLLKLMKISGEKMQTKLCSRMAGQPDSSNHHPQT